MFISENLTSDCVSVCECVNCLCTLPIFPKKSPPPPKPLSLHESATLAWQGTEAITANGACDSKLRSFVWTIEAKTWEEASTGMNGYFQFRGGKKKEYSIRNGTLEQKQFIMWWSIET